MLRYIILSVFALLLLTACGGNDLDQAGVEEPITDTSSRDLSNVFENQAGSKPKDSEPLPPSISSGPYSGKDLTVQELLDAHKNREDLSGARLGKLDLTGANLAGANLSWVDLTEANLTGANLTDATLIGAKLMMADLTGADLKDAILTGVIGANFAGALNVPD